MKVHANKVKKAQRKRKNEDSPIRNELEFILVTYLINRAAYHGGDFTGKNLITFFDNAHEIFPKFREKLLSSTKENRCSNEEINKRCSRTEELCTLMDFLFSLARTPSGEVNNNILNKTETFIKFVVKNWRELGLSFKGPKIHAVKDHLLSLMKNWNGIGCFLEDFVEKEHQTGKLEDKRTGNMGNNNRRASSNSRHEWARKMVPKIKLEKKRIKSESTRKRTKRSIDSEETAAKKRKKRDKKDEKSVLKHVYQKVTLTPKQTLCLSIGMTTAT